MSYLLITSREKFIFEPISVIDIETTVIEFLKSEFKRFYTRYAGEADGSINKYEIPLRFCLYMQSVVSQPLSICIVFSSLSAIVIVQCYTQRYGWISL